jgi:hypothetical protein
MHFTIYNSIHYSTQLGPERPQKTGIPPNPLSPLLFILSSNKLCDNVFKALAVWFNAPYLRADVAPLRYQPCHVVGSVEAYNRSRMSKPFTWSILPLIFSSRIRETTRPSASVRLTFRDCSSAPLHKIRRESRRTLAKNCSSSLVYGLMRSMMNCVRSERKRSLMK